LQGSPGTGLSGACGKITIEVLTLGIENEPDTYNLTRVINISAKLQACRLKSTRFKKETLPPDRVRSRQCP
jgi:hypothetical protein